MQDLAESWLSAFQPDGADIAYIATRDKKHLISASESGWIQVWDRFPDGRPHGLLGSVHISTFANLEVLWL